MDATDPPGEQDLLTPYEAAVMLSVSPSTLRRYSNDGRLPVYRLPSGHRRFARADLLALLDKHPASP